MEENESKVVRGTVDMDYVPLESIGENQNNEVFNDQTPNTLEQPQMEVQESINTTPTVETTSSNQNSQVTRNAVDLNFVDLEKNPADEKPLTQDELDENILGETKYNEAGKKEIRVEVDPVVTDTHKKDAKIKNLFKFGLLAVAIIIGIFIYMETINNKQELFQREIKAAAEEYINNELNQSILSSLYLGKTNEVIISVSDLSNEGFYEGDFIDPKTKDNVEEQLVRIYLENGKLTYQFPYEK